MARLWIAGGKLSGFQQLMSLTEPERGTGWVHPPTGTTMWLDSTGVYRVCRRSDGEDEVVILGQIPMHEAKPVLSSPRSAASLLFAWDFIKILDDAPARAV